MKILNRKTALAVAGSLALAASGVLYKGYYLTAAALAGAAGLLAVAAMLLSEAKPTRRR